MAVGRSDDGLNSDDLLTNPGSFSENWNGSAWTVVPTAPSAGANPGLNSIACASPTFCVAVGETQSAGGGIFDIDYAGSGQALVETWNGVAWTVRANPAGPSSALFGVSCSSASFCVAVGSRGGGNVASANLVEAWDGAGWRIQSAPTVGYGQGLTAVSCSGATACTAVGSFNRNRTGIGLDVPLAERWSGRAWTLERPPPENVRVNGKLLTNDTDLTGVSCTSPSFCMASGAAQRAQNGDAFGAYATRWDGNRWTSAIAGLPHNSPFWGISCLSSAYCLAVGQFDSGVFPPPGSTQPLVEGWNGEQWGRMALPHVAPLPGASWAFPDAADPVLTGISCVAGVCTAVGDQANGTDSAPLALRESGTPLPPPPPPPPVYGRTADAQTVSGTVLVKEPGSKQFVSLSSATSVPLGSVIDTTNGTVRLTTAADTHGHTQTGLFYSGPFRVTQTKGPPARRGGPRPVPTVLTLVGAPSGCGGAAAAANRPKKMVSLWGNTRGNYSIHSPDVDAGSRDPKWLVEETCTGTLIKVVSGVVDVLDLHTHKTTTLRAGGSFFAAATPTQPTKPAVARCTSGQLTARPGQLSAATGHVIDAFSLVNRSDRTCTLYGYPKVQMLNAHGAPMATHAIEVPPGSVTFFGKVGPEQVVTLSPGRKAWFWLIFEQPSFFPGGCPTSSALRITPSGTGRGLTLTGSAGRLSTRLQGCSSFDITPLAGAGPRFP